MDQQRVGHFLKALRQEKGLTQAQLAERLGVSNRSVSRWETGANMPDLSLLIQLAEVYGVDVGEILHGERRVKAMNESANTPWQAAADCAQREKQALTRRSRGIFLAGLAALTAHTALRPLGASAGIWQNISEALLGMAHGALLLGVLLTGRDLSRLRAFKQRLLGRGHPAP